ncbi:MAG: ribonuclease P protein component [Pirellulaceae bacterium]
MNDDPGRPDVSLPKRMLIRRKEEYDLIFRSRCSAGDGTLVVYAERNGLDHPRLGMVVSGKKVGNAVARNRWKRMIREAFRQIRPTLPPGIDLVVLPQTKKPPHLLQLQKGIHSLARRATRKLESRPAPRRES